MMSSNRGKCVVCLSAGEKKKKKGWHRCYLELELSCRINSLEVNTLATFYIQFHPLELVGMEEQRLPWWGGGKGKCHLMIKSGYF